MSHETPVQPNLNDLFTRFLQRQTEAQAAGIASYDNEVTPYEVGPMQPLDPKLAWDESLSAIGSAQLEQRQAPPHWSALVANHESMVAIAYCIGNFPQLMRDFHTVLTEPNLAKMRPEGGRPASAPELTEWTETVARRGKFPQMLLALGVLRLAGHFDAAQAFVHTHDAQVPAGWRAAWENEKAALAWHSGRSEEARRIWDSLEPTTVVLFNRGMAALFTGDASAARNHLAAAVSHLAENSAWHHLGRLYLTMAQMRSSSESTVDKK
jgi:hypothetical protein